MLSRIWYVLILIGILIMVDVNAAEDIKKTTYLKDYKPSVYLIDRINLEVDIYDKKTIVTAKLNVKRNPKTTEKADSLILHGEKQELISVEINDKLLERDKDYLLDEKRLTILHTADIFTVKIISEIIPEQNTELSGLYKSKGMLVTQCESEGFRRITYYLDRPDVMALFTTTIKADAFKYPELLSNGNLIEKSDLPNGRHMAKWSDPFRKPCYLFALVAGKLTCVQDKYITKSGREVQLKIFVEEKNINKCAYAMQSLKNSMQWDEKTYGLEYDLDLYMIVATDDFNFGAMENKGLNIFNSKYVLADIKTATDTDFKNVERVIGHEYFHNWTGNRITCRDWFQLSLKEGLTVFREQQFAADMSDQIVSRIKDVQLLKTHQFSEDGGPMAHPVRPESYMEINNFYTATIYEKGAEVIRMIKTIVGIDGFKKGMALYISRNDGSAATVEDFVQAMSDANNIDLTQFKRWYTQAATPLLSVKSEYNPQAKEYTLIFKQSCRKTAENAVKYPFVIPVKLSLISRGGVSQVLTLKGEKEAFKAASRVIIIKDLEQKIVFSEISEEPIPSLLQEFSAPVKLDYDYSVADLLILAEHDVDLFNRFEAAQKLFMLNIKSLVDQYKNGEELVVSGALLTVMEKTLADTSIDKALAAKIISLPGYDYIVEQYDVVDIDAVIAARTFLYKKLALALESKCKQIFNAQETESALDYEQMSQRALKNTCLLYLAKTENPDYKELIIAQGNVDNMTDVTAAMLAAINLNGTEVYTKLLSDFYIKWQDEALVVNKWLTFNATIEQDGLFRVKELLKHPAFSYQNPNNVYALLLTFAKANFVNFHAIDGSGYDFIASQVIYLDTINPSVASRLASTLTMMGKLDPERQQLMRKALIKIKAQAKLSEHVYEVIAKALAHDKDNQ